MPDYCRLPSRRYSQRIMATRPIYTGDHHSVITTALISPTSLRPGNRSLRLDQHMSAGIQQSRVAVESLLQDAMRHGHGVPPNGVRHQKAIYIGHPRHLGKHPLHTVQGRLHCLEALISFQGLWQSNCFSQHDDCLKPCSIPWRVYESLWLAPPLSLNAGRSTAQRRPLDVQLAGAYRIYAD